VPIVVVTRLRLQDHGLRDDFFVAAVALVEPATRSPAPFLLPSTPGSGAP
jgi:hypothetical protein